MKFNLDDIQLSKNDIKMGLKLPTKLNEDLAEDIGIMIGDGHIGKWVRPKRAVEYQIIVYGNSETDKSYFIKHLIKLKSKLFGKKFKIYIRNRRKEIELRTCSKGLLEFYTKVINLPLNKKENIGIPNIMFSNKSYLNACLRGIVDTDFSFCIKKNNYPVLKLGTASKNLVLDCKKALNMVGIEVSIKTDVKEIHSKTKRPFITNYLYLSGEEKIQQYVNQIGFGHPKNIKKLIKWAHSSAW